MTPVNILGDKSFGLHPRKYFATSNYALPITTFLTKPDPSLFTSLHASFSTAMRSLCYAFPFQLTATNIGIISTVRDSWMAT